MRPPAGDNESLVHHALEELNHHWESTNVRWRDVTRAEFEREHLDELRRAATNAERGMRAITELLRQVVKECS